MRFVIIILASFSILSACAHKRRNLCDNVTLREGELSLSRNEKTLVCGSDKSKDGWKDVPLPQAQYHIKILLQQNGYYNPRFERNGDQLDVWVGERERIKSFSVTGGEGILSASRKRQVVGEPMVPEKLNEIENWAETSLRNQGYACPVVDLRAQAYDGQVITALTPNGRQRVASVKRIGMDMLDEDALSRYQAFDEGDMYDVRETQATVGRMLRDGLFQSAYFTTTCRGDLVDLTLRANVGQPRLLRFGLGASTEEFPFVDLSFKNAKLDRRASSLTATLHASPIEQRFDFGTELYILPWSKRTYFGPRFTTKRRSERAYELLKTTLGADLGRNWDMWNWRWQARGGPTINYENTVRGVGPDDVSYLSWEGSLNLMSHPYEVFVRDQYEGWNGGLLYRGQRKGLGSELNVDRYEVNFKHLWNVRGFSPPLFVVATRFELIGVNANAVEMNQNRNQLPVEYRIFYGGDENLRGFARQTLKNGDLGYLSAAMGGVELRLIEELPYRLEPFFLFDLARLGDQRLELDPPWYSSTGLGLRWPSPFGTLRGSAARGKIQNGDAGTDRYPQEWVYFVSFGQEF